MLNTKSTDSIIMSILYLIMRSCVDKITQMDIVNVYPTYKNLI